MVATASTRSAIFPYVLVLLQFVIMCLTEYAKTGTNRDTYLNPLQLGVAFLNKLGGTRFS